MAMVGETVRARALWNGERFSLQDREGVYVIKTYRDTGSSVMTTRAERRLASMTGGFLGRGKRWKTWAELNSPIEEQDIEQEVIKVPS